MMDTKTINLFVYDTLANFEKSKKFLGEEGTAFKKIFCIESITDLDNYLNSTVIGNDENVFLVVHVFAFEKISGIKKFLISGIPEKYSLLKPMFISDGIDSEIKHLMVDAKIPHAPVYKYHEVYSNLREDKIIAYTKDYITMNCSYTSDGDQAILDKSNLPYPKIKFAVITALFKDEFEELQKVFFFPEEKQIRTAKKIFYRGYLKSNESIEIVAAIPNSTGMVDSSILATQMLEFFKPDYLLMSGVCGASSEFGYGDIIIAKQVFIFQKGKVSDIRKKNPTGELVPIELFDRNQHLVDYNNLYDKEGNQILISIEKFEKEHDSIIQLNSLFEDSLNLKLGKIVNGINETIKKETFFNMIGSIKIVLEPMACSTMVINKGEYFEDVIRSVHRKTAAVEMESYGVARACEYANNGKTIPIIFKSVMDNASNKSDFLDGFNLKKFAAFTSAQFMKHLFEENVI